MYIREPPLLRLKYTIKQFLFFFTGNKAKDQDTIIFLAALEFIKAELCANQNKKAKFIFVCPDDCSLDELPAIQVLLQIYNVPSKINDLVIGLMGGTRRQLDREWPLDDDEEYNSAKRNLLQVINKIMKRNRSSINGRFITPYRIQKLFIFK